MRSGETGKNLSEMIKKAISEGKEALVTVLRTDNFYPIGTYANVIADSVMEIYGKNENFSKELLFDDLDLFETFQEAPQQEKAANS